MLKLQGWLLVNWKKLLIGVGGVCVLVLLAIGFVQYGKQREISASEALSEIPLPAVGGTAPRPGIAEAYLKVAREHAGTKAAARAALQAAGVMFLEGKYAEAQKQFEAFPREYPESEWGPQALLGVAAALDVQGKTNEAIAKFEEVRRRYGVEPVAEEAKLALGRLYEAQGRHEEAFKLYDDLLKGASMAFQSGIGMEAQMRLQGLIKKYPDLARPKQPVVPPSLVTTGAPGSNVQVFRMTNQPLRSLTNRPLLTMTNRAPSAVTNRPLLTLTNRPPSTGGAPLQIQPSVTTNK